MLLACAPTLGSGAEEGVQQAGLAHANLRGWQPAPMLPLLFSLLQLLLTGHESCVHVFQPLLPLPVAREGP